MAPATDSAPSPTSIPPCRAPRSGRHRSVACAPFHRGFRPTVLAWSADGLRLLAMNPVRLIVLDASLRPIGPTTASGGNRRSPRPRSRREGTPSSCFAARRRPGARALTCSRRAGLRGRSRPSSGPCTASRRRPMAARCWSAGVQQTSGCSCRRRLVRARAVSPVSRRPSDRRRSPSPTPGTRRVSTRRQRARSPRARARAGAG